MKLVITSMVLFISGISGLNLAAQNGIMDHLYQNEKFSILIDLLEVTEYDQILTDENYYTLFAPDNDAFLAHYTLSQIDSLKVNDIEKLSKLIQHHIVPDTVDINDNNKMNIPLFGDPHIFFIDASGLYRLGQNGNSKMNTAVEVENGVVLELFCNILINKDENLKDYNTLLSYWYHFSSPSFLELDELTIIDSIRSTNEDITIIGLSNFEAIQEYVLENAGEDRDSFVDSLIRRHTINGVYPLQNIYDGLVVKNWLDEDILFTIEDDEYFVNGIKIPFYSLYLDGVILYLEYDNNIMESIQISNTEEKIFAKAKLFPNPASSELIIELPIVDQNSQLQIIDLHGNIVFQKSHLKEYSSIDIGHLNSGIYILNFILAGNKYSQKLIKI